MSDTRPEVWSLVPPELNQAARNVGGIVGAGDLTGCREYRTLAEFSADRDRHLNDPAWFEPVLYGFTFSNLIVLPFRPYRGWIRFFAVE